MSGSAAQVLRNRNNPNAGTAFAVVERRIPCQFKFQFYVDYGSTHGGPWVKVGMNDTELGIGFLPKHVPTKLKVATPHSAE